MDDCLFCRIVAGDIPATMVLETPLAVAFADVNPQAPVHVLVVPRTHYANAAGVAAADPALAGALLGVCGQVAEAAGLDPTGYRIVLNTGPDAGQSVAHVHAHVLGGQAMGWPPFP